VRCAGSIVDDQIGSTLPTGQTTTRTVLKSTVLELPRLVLVCLLDIHRGAKFRRAPTVMSIIA
jgi:hypothetical protein